MANGLLSKRLYVTGTKNKQERKAMNYTKSDEGKMTLTDAARTLGVTVRTVQRAVKDGLLDGVTHGLRGRVYWVTRASVERALAEIGRGGAK